MNDTATGTVLALIEDCTSDLSLLPILADALEDSGENDFAAWAKAPTEWGLPPTGNAVKERLKAWAFFARNEPGPAYDSILSYGWKLAMAERHAKEEGWEYRWEDDPHGCSCCDCDDPDCAACSDHETLGCVLLSWDGEDEDGAVEASILGSLWGICGASDDYKRVVEAELALEAMEREKD